MQILNKIGEFFELKKNYNGWSPFELLHPVFIGLFFLSFSYVLVYVGEKKTLKKLLKDIKMIS